MKRELLLNTKKIITVDSLIELDAIIKGKDNFIYLAGGTFLRNFDKESMQKAEFTIYLNRIRELGKISYLSNGIDIGAGIFMQEILNQENIPSIIKQAVRETIPPWIRRISTIGGSLFTGKKMINMVPLLEELKAKIEYRINRKTKWRNLKPGDSIYFNLEENALLTKIKIPYLEYNIQFYKVLGEFEGKKNLALSILGYKNKEEVLEELKINFYFLKTMSLKIDTKELISKQIPFNVIEIDLFFKKLFLSSKFSFFSENIQYLNCIESELKTALLSLHRYTA